MRSTNSYDLSNSEYKEASKIFGAMLKSIRTCFFYSDTIKAYIRIKLDEEGRNHVEASPTLDNLPKRATRRYDGEYLLWNENPGVREMVNSRLFKILGNNIKEYKELILDGEGELVQ